MGKPWIWETIYKILIAGNIFTEANNDYHYHVHDKEDESVEAADGNQKGNNRKKNVE